jgi:5-methylcytosine-specific restriction enzyme subunit McrC
MSKQLQVFEYSTIEVGEKNFEIRHFKSLVKLNELHKNQYFTVGLNKITFKNYVGVIQVDGLVIEILPKIDNDHRSEAIWQKALIEMLRVTRKLKVQKVGDATVKKQQIHLLDIYFEWFLTEVQLLIHQGLIKQYYTQTAQVKALKGKLEFAQHLTKNLVHKERFLTSHQVYDKDHLVHQIIFQALDIIAQLTKGNYLYSKCKTVQLHFPEVQTIFANENTFNKIPVSRKTAPYQTAISIARLIILNFAPNVSSGNEKMLALLFDMNSLWEEYVLIRLQQSQFENVEVFGQESKSFWKTISIRPDILIQSNNETFVIDTKWKKMEDNQPSTNDLRQMYVYNEFWNAKKAMLLYPSKQSSKIEEKDFTDFRNKKHACTLGKISIFNAANSLDENIGNIIMQWFVKK